MLKLILQKMLRKRHPVVLNDVNRVHPVSIDVASVIVSQSKGSYDLPTIEQVRRVQDTLGLPARGIVDAATWHALQTPACALYTD